MLKNGRNLHTHTHTHGCLCKIIPAIASLAIINPSFADIAKNAQSATCDSSTIGTTTGPANLQAAWTANTINLDFYSNDTKVGTGTCSYDGAITLPATPTVPTGYTFGGWKVRVANTGFDLSTWNYGSYVNSDRYDLNDAGYNIIYPDTWASEFTNGIVYGQIRREYSADAEYLTTNIGAVVNGEMDVQEFFANYTQLAGSEKAAQLQQIFQQYSSGQITQKEAMVALTPLIVDNCYCKATGYRANINAPYQSVASSSWVLLGNVGVDGDPMCLYECATNVGSDSAFRAQVFGQSN